MKEDKKISNSHLQEKLKTYLAWLISSHFKFVYSDFIVCRTPVKTFIGFFIRTHLFSVT